MTIDVKYTVQDIIDNVRWAIEQANGHLTRSFYRDLADKGAIPERIWGKYFPTFKALLAAATDYVPPKKENEELNTFTANSWNIDLPKTRIHTLDQLLEYCQVDLTLWEVTNFIVNKWEVGAKDQNGDLQVEPLYQVKANLKKRVNIVDSRVEIEKLKEVFKKESPVVSFRFDDLAWQTSTSNMLEITIPDAHFGKMAWHKETGGPSYDTPIAAATFLRALKTLLARSSGFFYERIVLVIGNDLLNSDNEQGTTTKGTFVSTDGRYQKTFVTVRETVTEAIKLCAEIAPVHVVMVSGNHDDLGVWHLGDSLECLFANDENITIDNEPRYRKYVRYGNTLLMFTHGDKGKREDYPLLMATEKSQDFGDTKFREIHTGHIHQTKLQEWHGVRVRILPSLSPPDAWHAENGFTGQQRNAEAYVWNYTEGLVAQFFHNDEVYPEITTDRVLKEG